MGGFTKIQLKDCSQENIDLQNEKLTEIGLRKDIHFYSENDIKEEYEFYKKDDGYFPTYQFPSEKINSYEDFKFYWTRVGEPFVPPIGALTFDCYFNRTSQRAMNKIAKYLLNNREQIAEVDGSFLTFVKRTSISQKRKNSLKTLCFVCV